MSGPRADRRATLLAQSTLIASQQPASSATSESPSCPPSLQTTRLCRNHDALEVAGITNIRSRGPRAEAAAGGARVVLPCAGAWPCLKELMTGWGIRAGAASLACRDGQGMTCARARTRAKGRAPACAACATCSKPLWAKRGGGRSAGARGSPVWHTAAVAAREMNGRTSHDSVSSVLVEVS